MPLRRALIAMSVVFLACAPSRGPVDGPSRSAAFLIEGGTILTMTSGATELPETDLLVRDGIIRAIGKHLSANPAAVAGATVIDARGQVVMPGFVDAHSHLFVTTMRGQFRNTEEGSFFPLSSSLAQEMTAEDAFLAERLGALELLSAGVTTTADFDDAILGPAHAEAAIRGLTDAGIRARFYMGGPDKTTKKPIDLELLERLARTKRPARIEVGLGWRLPADLADETSWAMRDREYQAARRLGLRIQVHVSGKAEPMFDALIARKYVGRDLEIIHATRARADQRAALEAAGASLVVTPISEERVGYGLTVLGEIADVTRLGIGVDGNSLSGSADVFQIMAVAALTATGEARKETAISPRSLLELATRRGAEALGLGDLVGTLAVGKRADLQMIDLRAVHLAGFAGGDPSALLVYGAKPSDVKLVMVDGVIRKLDGNLVDVDTSRLVAEANASARALVTRAQHR